VEVVGFRTLVNGGDGVREPDVLFSGAWVDVSSRVGSREWQFIRKDVDNASECYYKS